MKQFLFYPLIFLFFSGYAQRQPQVDFIQAEVSLAIDPEAESVQGQVEYRFQVLQDVDSVFLDARNMDFSSVRLNRKKIKYANTGSQISIIKKLKSGKDYRLRLNYTCTPEQTVYFSGWDDEIPDNEQVWTQGQGKYTSHWLPSFDDMEEKVEFDLNITFDDSYEVIANGVLEIGPKNSDVRQMGARKKQEDTPSDFDASARNGFGGKKTWHFDMEHPMSSYLLAFAIGNYEKQELSSKSGIPIKNYYYPKDSLRVEPTYRHTLEIFDFLEDEIGIPYPWRNYKQVPVHDFLYAGMENTGATIFSDAYVIDSTAFVDKNYVNVNAHELAHQWFGNLVTEKDAEHHWLHEGFATYYAYLAEKQLFGDDHFYWKLYETLSELNGQGDRGEGESLLDPKASSLTFYEKGAWAIFMLREKIGDQAFREGIRNYLRKYRFQNVTVPQFLEEMRKISGQRLDDFERDWLRDMGIPFKEAKSVLSKRSPSLKLLFDLESEIENTKNNTIKYDKYWSASTSIHLKKYILEKYHHELSPETIQEAFASDTVPVRQALSTIDDLKKYPEEAYESLLKDKSHVTVENALFKLWQTHPEDRKKYLDATRNTIGLPNKNLRMLWLTLAILTENYEGKNTKVYFDELSGYTDARYSFEVRQGAFFYLKEAFGFTDANLKDLVRATNHHSWQFRKTARDILKGLLQDDDYEIRVQKLTGELKPEDLRYLNSINR